MKILYLDCSMGASGDMIAGALAALLPDRAAVLSGLNSLGIPGVEYSIEDVLRCGIKAARLTVSVRGREEVPGGRRHDDGGHSHSHCHRSLRDVLGVVEALSLGDAEKETVQSIYRDIANAEGEVHGKDAGEVHFHELGAMDAIADICAVVHLAGLVAPDEIVASPVNLGSGTVRCAHGEMPVPAPATVKLLDGVPAYGDGSVRGELCTPTGAALLRRLAARFGDMPAMRVEKSAMGAGAMDFPRPNVVRAIVGTSVGRTAGAARSAVEIRFNVDDMTGEEMQFASAMIFKAGALDVSTVPCMMKKGRNGTMFFVVCREEARDAVAAAVFRHTTTAGLRFETLPRLELDRREETAVMPGGMVVRRKLSGRTAKIEADDIAALAIGRGLSFFEARGAAEAEFAKEKGVPHGGE